jgi:hypothetical protein
MGVGVMRDFNQGLFQGKQKKKEKKNYQNE